METEGTAGGPEYLFMAAVLLCGKLTASRKVSGIGKRGFCGMRTMSLEGGALVFPQANRLFKTKTGILSLYT